MHPRFAAVLLVFCGFAVTDAQARPRTVPDTVAATSDTLLKLTTLGPSTLSGLWLPANATLGLKAGDAVEVKPLPRDRHGRTPVLLYKAGAKTTLQEQLLGAGKAMLYDRAASPAAWKKQESAARNAKRGLWAKPPLTPDQAGEHMGEMVRLRASVTRTYKSRAMHYINFGEDWKTDFSLRIPRAAWRAFGKDFIMPAGSCVEARGYVFMDNGPMIELTRPEQLEIRDADTCTR